MITTQLGVSLKIVFDFFIKYAAFKEHLNICLIRIVNDLLYELFPFACVCLNDIMFVCVI